MSNRANLLFNGLLLLATSAELHAQPDTVLMQLTDASDLLALDSGNFNLSVSTEIATLSAGEPREAPGVITIITAEEIAASGARDLPEALTLVPGLHLGRDVDDVINMSIRGNWAEEGKCLYMINGVFLNEVSFGTFHLGQGIPLGNVSRIEVISGPGSVIYGGFAALGVVNIVTKDTREFEGAEAVVQAGAANGMISRLNGHVFGSSMVGPKTEMSYSILSGAGVVSTEKVMLSDDHELSYGDSSRMDHNQFMVAMHTPRTHAQVFFAHRQSEMSENVYTLEQRDLLIDVEHTVPIGRGMDLILRSQYRNQLPWSYINDTSRTTALYNATDQRWSQSALLLCHARNWLDLRTGLSAYTEASRLQGLNAEFNTSGGRELQANDVAIFSEATVSRNWGSTTVGARAEKNTFSDMLIAPRFAWTKAWRHLHLKLLYSTAFRLQTLQNIELASHHSPLGNEWTYTTETEFGWGFGRGTELIMHLFRVDIHQPIVYVYDDEDHEDQYHNRERSGTAGIDIKVKHSSRSLFITLGYGNYQVVRSKSALPEAELPAPYDLSYQSIPRHKITLVGAWKATTQVSLETRVGWQSAAWSYQDLPATDTLLALVTFPSSLTADMGVRYRPRWIPGFSARIGLRNMLDHSAAILSPFATGLPPIPVNHRELSLELHYTIGR